MILTVLGVFFVKCNILFFLFSASGLSRVSLHRSIWFDLENYILFEQHTANILVQSKSFRSIRLWYWGSSCCCKCKGSSICQNKRGQFKNSLLGSEHKIYLDPKMYFTFYFPFSYCHEFFISKKVLVWTKKTKYLRIRLRVNIYIDCSCNTENEEYYLFYFQTVQYLPHSAKEVFWSLFYFYIMHFLLNILFRICHPNCHKLLIFWKKYAFF